MMEHTRTAKRLLALAGAVLALLAVAYLPLPEGLLTAGEVTLSPAGRVSVGTLAFCLVLWMTEALPFHITGLLGMIALALQGTAGFSEIVKLGFGNQIIVFFIGVLCISSFISRSGLGKRLCLFVLSRTGNSTGAILLGFLTVGALLSMWVTDMAVAAILMPLAKAMLEEEGLQPLKSNFGKALMISCAWGPLIGGIGTPAGAGPNPIAIGFIREMTGVEITFLEWMCYGVPAALVLIPPAWLVLMAFFRPEIKQLSKTREDLRREFRQLPPPGREEKITLGVFLVTVALWLGSDWLAGLLGIEIPTALPAIIGGCLFFLPGLTRIPWKAIQQDVAWDGIILTVSGISLGMLIYQTGAAQWLSQILLGGIVTMGPLAQIFVIILMISLLKVALSSNTVTATVIIPIIIAMAVGHGLPVMGVVIPASLTLSLAFILVTSTPTSVIPHSSGYFSIMDMAKAGAAMTLLTSVLMTAVIYGVGGIRGIY